MEKEAQKPQIAPPRIRNIGEVLRELRGYPGMPNQVHLTTHKVSLTEEEYLPTEAMEKVKNIATLIDVLMDKDFLERYPGIYRFFYISPKDIPQELIDSLESLGPNDQYVYFIIDREKGTLKPISKEAFDILNPNERGKLHRSVLNRIREGGPPCIGFLDTGWWGNYSTYSGNEIPLLVPFTESTD